MPRKFPSVLSLSDILDDEVRTHQLLALIFVFTTFAAMGLYIHEAIEFADFKQEAIDNKHAYWHVDQSTGKKTFRWMWP